MLTTEVILRVNTRQQAIEILEQLYEKGYRYVARDKDSDFFELLQLET